MNTLFKLNSNSASKGLSIITTAVASAGLFVSSFVHAAVTLNVDNNIKVTAINGQAVNTSMLQDPQRQFTLQSGQHVITAKYDRLFEFHNNDHDFLRSGNITVIAQMADNQTYQLVMPNQPENYNEAKEYAKHPTLAVMQGSKLIASKNVQNSGGGFLSGIGNKVGGWFGNDAIASNNQAIAAINSQNPNSHSNNYNSYSSSQDISSSKAIVTKPQQPTGSTLDQFMQIWLKATPEERERIRGWVSK